MLMLMFQVRLKYPSYKYWEKMYIDPSNQAAMDVQMNPISLPRLLQGEMQVSRRPLSRLPIIK